MDLVYASEHDPGRERQLRLAAYNRERLSPRLPPDLDPLGHAPRPDADLLADEARFLLEERIGVVARPPRRPTTRKGSSPGSRSCAPTGPGQGDPLFPWLAEIATSAKSCAGSCARRSPGEAGFEDLARAHAGEASRARQARDGAELLGRDGARPRRRDARADAGAARRGARRVAPDETIGRGSRWRSATLWWRWPATAVRAITRSARSASSRSPRRGASVVNGTVRLGVRPHARQYFALHATLDKQHSVAWNAEVLTSLVNAQPRVAQAIAEGGSCASPPGRAALHGIARRWASAQPGAAVP